MLIQGKCAKDAWAKVRQVIRGDRTSADSPVDGITAQSLKWSLPVCSNIYGSAIPSACTQIYNSRANWMDIRNGGLPNARLFESYSYSYI